MGTDRHLHDWPGYHMVSALRAAHFQILQISGLLVARRTECRTVYGASWSAKEYVQRPDQTPADFWREAYAAEIDACPTCGHARAALAE